MDRTTKQRIPNGASNSLRAIPSTDRVLAHPAVTALNPALPQSLITMAVREELDAIRHALLQGELQGEIEAPTLAEVAMRAATRALDLLAPSLKPVINATGVIIHTNLGRAPLSQSALVAITEAAGYSNLEYNLAEGARGSRYSHAAAILRRVTGCEDAIVVNNNAAALVLALSTFAAGREAILSRGQSVEIGGGFRIPEIMQTSGVRLSEVGTTNRTYVKDYAEAITSDTSIIMRVHASNFRITGFTATPTLAELAALAHEHNLLMIDDIGSGALLDTTHYGLSPEPMVQSSIEVGADLVLFSGDKLLGGPQCGIIAGKSALIARLKKHPLTRALRVDKITLAALEATLLHYLKGEAACEIPVWRMIAMSEDALQAKATLWASQLASKGVACATQKGRSTIGGGSLPGETLPTWLVAITHNDQTPEQAVGQLASQLRHNLIPIIARVDNGTLLLDPRTVLEGQESVLLEAVARIATANS